MISILQASLYGLLTNDLDESRLAITFAEWLQEEY